MQFNYRIVFPPGNRIATANMRFRSPEKQEKNEEFLTEKDIHAYVSYMMETVPSSVNRLNEIRKDIPCSLIIEFCKSD